MNVPVYGVERIRDALSFIPSDDRELWIRVGMAVQSELGADGFDLWDAWSQRNDAYNEREARSVWRSFKGGGITIASLFKEARDRGYTDRSTPEPIDPQERARRDAEREQRRQEQDAQDRERREAAVTIAGSIWNSAQPSDGAHPYLRAKGIRANGARIGDWPVIDTNTGKIRYMIEDALILQIRDFDKRIHSVQAIMERTGEDGRREFTKLFLRDGAKRGHFFPVGQPRTGADGRRTFIVAEGFATAASVHEATGHGCVAALDAGNLAPVCRGIRGRFPDAHILIVGDRDAEDHAKSTGSRKAAEAALEVGACLFLPEWCDGGCDANDLFVRGFHHTWLDIDGNRRTVDITGPEHLAGCVELALAAGPLDADGFRAMMEGRVVCAVSLVADGEPTARMVAPVHLAPPLRTIQVVAGELPRVVDDAEQALLEQCSDLYQRAGSIIRPAMVRIEVADGRQIEGVRLVMVKKHHLAERLTAAANWLKFDGRSQDFVPMDAPLKVAETYAAREGLWKLRTLAGVVNAPTLRADGSILDQPGFDLATGLLFEPGSCVFESIPDQPTKDDADEALSRLEALVESFPFVAASDQAVALSAILTACIRRSLPTAPMHAFSAPAAGSGKSMLVDVASIIACGRQAAVLSQGRDEAEAEKRIGSALLAGDQVLSLDNCTSPLDGELLCQVHTQPTVRLRILGVSELRDVPTNTAMFATGNCLVVQGDMTRRVLLCSLDPKCERPELREFAFSPMDMARAGRAAYLRDALTVLRAFHVAGRPRQANPLGSFEAWSNWVRGALLWLGRPDPAETMEKARQSDPKLEALRAVMHQWGEVIGSDRITIANLIKRAIETEPSYGQGKPAFRNEGLREALLTIAGQGGAINSRALGRWLSAHKDKIVDGMRFQQVGKWQGVALWSLTGGESSASTPF